jgi:hypothetical protein
MTMMKLITYSLAAMLGLFNSPLLAEGSAYQIELIVFSQKMHNTEVFDQTSRAIQWPSDLTELSAYRQPENTTLDDGYAALSKDSAYRPIFYAAWVQPVAAGGTSAAVHIQSGDGNLNGYVRMQQDQGLQMVVDLELGSDSDDDSGNEMVYRLKEKRPIKPGETYYLDHPKFGVIAKVKPL